MNTKIKTN